MRKIILAVFVGLTAVAISQYHKPEAASGQHEPVPHWDKGNVDGRTYRNASVGLELTPPPGLEFNAPELKGIPGTLPLFVTITAVGEFKPLTARKVIAFYTEVLPYRPSTLSPTDAYILTMVRDQRNLGYEPVESTSHGKLGGIVFARQDFKKGVVYESVLVKACDGPRLVFSRSLVFIFSGADQETVNKLSAETELKLDPATSKCILSATNDVKK
jgi:hypothetical protein